MVRLRCSEIKSEVKLFTARKLILHGHGELSRGWITPSGSLFVRSCGRVCFEQEARLWISPCRDLTFHTEGPRGRNFVVIFKPQPTDLRALAQILRSRFAICLYPIWGGQLDPVEEANSTNRSRILSCENEEATVVGMSLGSPR